MDLDEKYEIIEYIEEAYEPLHLTGIKGIVEEVESYINKQKESH